MIILWFFLWVLLFLLLLLLLLTVIPFELKIDTVVDDYSFRWRGIMEARAIPVADDILLRLRVFFWKKEWLLIDWAARLPAQQKPEKASVRKEKKAKPFNKKWLRKGLRVLQSFRVRRFRLNLDSGDYVTNAYLYPAFYFLSKGNRRLQINFAGETSLQLRIDNQILRMLFAALR